jgi:hypothetical protein
MAIYHGFITNDQAISPSEQGILALKNACEAEGWTTLQYDTTTRSGRHHWVGSSTGLSGTENIIVGGMSYSNSSTQRFHMTSGAWPFYNTDAYYTSQSIEVLGVDVGNDSKEAGDFNLFFSDQTTEYYILVNSQRYIMITITDGDVMTFTTAGKMFAFAKPDKYPSPLVVSYRISYNQRNIDYLFLRPGMVSETATLCTPYDSGPFDSSNSPTIREVDGVFSVFPIHVGSGSNGQFNAEVYGQVDGIFACTGENLTNLSVIQVGGSSTVDITGMSVLDAVAAINNVGGDAYFACYNGLVRTWRDATCFLME